MWDQAVRNFVCGRLSVDIISGNVEGAKGLAVLLEGAAPWFSLPFGQPPVERVVPIDDRYFVACGRLGVGEGYCIAVLDAVERRLASPVISDKQVIRSSHLVVSKAKDRLWLVQARSSRSWSLPELHEFEPLECPMLYVEKAVVRADGAIIAKGRDGTPEYSKEPYRLLFAIPPDAEKAEGVGVAPIESLPGYAVARTRFNLSDGGRYLLRAHDKSLLLTEEDGRQLADLPNSDEIPDTDVIPLLQRIHITGFQEIWDAIPPKFLRRVKVRTLSLYDCLADKPTEAGAAFEQALASARRKYVGLSDQPADAARIAAAKKEMDRLDRLEDHFHKARNFLCAVISIAERAPHDAWVEGDPSFYRRKDEPKYARIDVFISAIKNVWGRVNHWGPEDDSFVLDFPDAFTRRVGIDGTLGDLEPTPAKAVWQPILSTALQAEATRFLDNECIRTFDLNALDEPSAIAVIGEIASLLRTDHRKVVWRDQMVIRFSHPGGTMSEEAFYNFVRDKCPGAVGSLRDLIAAYADGDLPTEVWSTELVAAGGFAARALAVLDDDAFLYLGPYFDSRDSAHEPFGLDQVIPAMRAFKSAESRRFALKVMADEYHHADIVADRILSDARASCEPDAFRDDLFVVADTVRSEWKLDDEDIVYQLYEPILQTLKPDEHSWDRMLHALIPESAD